MRRVKQSRKMLQGHANQFWLDRDWQMHVTDERAATVCDLRFSGTSAHPPLKAAEGNSVA